MSAVLNLTQHVATPDQVAAGVVDLPLGLATRDRLAEILTFDALPGGEEIGARAEALAELACLARDALPGENDLGAVRAMIGGAMWLMAPLAEELRAVGIAPVFAFSRRDSVETIGPDGVVRKTAAFRHVGFIDAV